MYNVQNKNLKILKILVRAIYYWIKLKWLNYKIFHSNNVQKHVWTCGNSKVKSFAFFSLYEEAHVKINVFLLCLERKTYTKV